MLYLLIELYNEVDQQCPKYPMYTYSLQTMAWIQNFT